MHFERHALALARRRRDSARGIVVGGARQVGKTALLRDLARDGGAYVTLDHNMTLRAARTDPEAFVADHVRSDSRPLFIDEFQRGGQPLLLALKAAMDEDDRRGQFVLAGSTRFLNEPRLSESLAGRVRFVDLWPLSQGEILGQRERFVDAIVAGVSALRDLTGTRVERRELWELVTRGGFPEAVLATSTRDRTEFLHDWARTTATRDVREVARVSDGADISRTLDLLSARTSSVLNHVTLAEDLGLTPQTARRYTHLLETVYTHHELPAWSRNLTAKVTHRPKVHLIDTGLAAALLGVDASGLSGALAPAAGPLLETFVANEIAKQATWAEADVRLHHWRDRSGIEVDLVIEARDGRVGAVEVKSSSNVDGIDARGLRVLRDRLGDTFVAGVVLYTGATSLQLDDRILALPVATLWAT